MPHSSIEFELPDGLGRLRLGRAVLDHFARYQQRYPLQKEAGGQLFAQIGDGLVNVVEATGPRRTDKRSRHRYQPDRIAEKQEIAARYVIGRHFVGDWHTHPQHPPEPSSDDIESLREMVTQSTHGLPGFFMVVVGKGQLQASLHVSFHTGTVRTLLKAIL